VSRLSPAGGQAAAQSLCASPDDVGVGMVKGSGVQSEENRDQMHRRTPQETMRRLISEGDRRRNVFIGNN